MQIDETKLNEFVGRAVSDLAAGYAGVMISLGRKLGLYKALAHNGPLDSPEIAKRAGCSERYVREWLNSQAAGGYVVYHPSSETYELTPEQAKVLADEDSPSIPWGAYTTPPPPPFALHTRCRRTAEPLSGLKPARSDLRWSFTRQASNASAGPRKHRSTWFSRPGREHPGAEPIGVIIPTNFFRTNRNIQPAA